MRYCRDLSRDLSPITRDNEAVRADLREIAFWLIDDRDTRIWLADLKTDGWRAGVLINALSEAERQFVRKCYESQAEWRNARLDRD